jgi:hypothetical protein
MVDSAIGIKGLKYKTLAPPVQFLDVLDYALIWCNQPTKCTKIVLRKPLD